MLAPLRFAIPGAMRVTAHTTILDVVANVLLFVPLGFLYPLTRRAESPSAVFVIGASVGAVIQALHLFEPGQSAALTDIAAAGVGALAGAMLLEGINRRIRINPRLVGRLSLEIPLMGLTYLMVPLLVTASLAALDDPVRVLLLIPLALLSARLIAALQEFHLGPAGVLRNRSMAAVSAGWMALAIFPVVLQYSVIGIALAAVVAGGTWYHASRPAVHGADRRYEVDVLVHGAPWLATYLLAAAVVPLTAGLGNLHVAFGLIGAGSDPARQVVRLLEPVAAFVVLGYGLAEARGRRELRFRTIAPRILAECAGVALGMEACFAFERGAGASILRLLLSMAAALFGARVYHDQRERVRWILIRRKPRVLDVAA